MFQPAVVRTNEGQRDMAEVQKKFEPKQEQLKQQNDEVESLQKRLQASGDKLSETERASLLKSIDEKQKALQRQAEDARNDYQSAMNDTYGQLAQKVYAVLQDYAKQNGFTVVLDGSVQQSPILFASDGTDITQAVIQAYNTKSGVPAPPPAAPSAPAPHATTTPKAPAASH
jgi:outer membrane protein